MGSTNQQTINYISSALQAMEQAYAHNHGNNVEPQIFRVVGALRHLMAEVGIAHGVHRNLESDSYELNDYNSAV